MLVLHELVDPLNIEANVADVLGATTLQVGQVDLREIVALVQVSEAPVVSEGYCRSLWETECSSGKSISSTKFMHSS